MFPVSQIWHIAVQAPGLILMVGPWVAWDLADRFFRKLPVASSRAYKPVAITLSLAVLGGRLTYAAENWPAFAASPISLISLNPSLWDWHGAAVLGLIAGIGYGRRHSVNFRRLGDSLTPSFGVMMR